MQEDFTYVSSAINGKANAQHALIHTQTTDRESIYS